METSANYHYHEGLVIPQQDFSAGCLFAFIQMSDTRGASRRRAEFLCDLILDAAGNKLTGFIKSDFLICN